MKYPKFILLSLLILSSLKDATGQLTATYTHSQRRLQEANDLYAKELYALAIEKYQQVFAENTEVYRESPESIYTQAAYRLAESTYRIHPEGGKLALENFIAEYSPDDLVHSAYYHIGSYYYDRRDYQQAIDAFARINQSFLSDEDKANLYFRQAYCHFVRKEFVQSRKLFEQVEDREHPYYTSAKYYEAMSAYFMKDYDKAVATFRSIENQALYKGLIPSYLSQILFAQGKYDELISYAESKLNIIEPSKTKDLHQLLGQAYYIKQDFNKALEHLEKYEQSEKKLTENQFYQLAYTQYRAGKYEKAANNFLELSASGNELGQNSVYYLADCYLKLKDLNRARNAFKKASEYTYSKAIRDEATFNYARLSAELGQDSEAINELVKIESSHPNYAEAQDLLGKLFVETKNYDEAIRVLDGMSNLSPELKNSFQKVLYNKAVILLQNKNDSQAGIYFERALEKIPSNVFAKKSLFWLSQIAYDKKNYRQSMAYLDRYFHHDATISIQDQENSHGASYTQGYNYLNANDYVKAGKFFEELTPSKIVNGNKDIEAEVFTRRGDCYFKQRKYDKAKQNYTVASKASSVHRNYAMYQSAILAGLTGDVYDKLTLLNQLVKEEPNSSFADDALLDMGNTYISLSHPDKAKTAFVQLIDNYNGKSPLVNQALLKLGLIEYNAGNSDKALSHYKKVFKQNPSAKESQEALRAIEEIYVDDLSTPDEYFKFVKNLDGVQLSDFVQDSLTYRTAEIQYQNAKYTEAKSALNNYLKTYPNGYYSLKSWYLLAECNTLLKDYSPALKNYEYVIKQGVSDHYLESILKAAEICYNHENDFGKAYVYYEKLGKESKDENQIFAAMKGALRSAHRAQNSEASIQYADLIIDHPRSNEDDKATAYFIKGKMYYAANKYDEAIDAFNEHAKLKNNEQSAEAKYLIASIFFKQGKLDIAEKLLNKNYVDSASYPYWVAKNLLLLADVYIRNKDYFSAQATLEAITENYQLEDENIEEAKLKLKIVKELILENTRIIDPAASDTLILENRN